MNSVRIKICGITSLQDLQLTVDAGTDAVGLVVDVLKSSRNLSISKAKQLIKSTPPFIETVAVTVPRDLTHLVRIQKKLNPSIIQVHGLTNQYKKIREELPDTRLIGVVQAKPDLSDDTVREVSKFFDAVLLDSYVPEYLGGSGITHDWEISKRIKELIHPKPLILAGGLKPTNVKEAIRTVNPYAVDVSSGVESSPGKKDKIKVFNFIQNVKEVEKW